MKYIYIGDSMAVFIQPITRLDYDELLAKTTPEMYKNVPVNFSHLPDSEIGKILDVWIDENDKNLLIGRIAVRDAVWNKYKDEFGGISVELVYDDAKNIVIPTRASILPKSVEPVIKDTLKFRFEQVKSTNKYSENSQQKFKTILYWDIDNKNEQDTLLEIKDLLKKIYKMVKPNTGMKVIDDEWDWQKEKEIIRKYCTKEDGTFDWKKYRQFFAWYDENKPENFSSYKFPHHTVRKGEIVLSKRALVAAMAYLNGARGVEIDDTIRKEAYKHIAAHYKKDLNKEPPELKKYGEIMDELLKKIETIIDEKIKSLYSKEDIEKMIDEKIKSLYSNDEIEKIKSKYSETEKAYEDLKVKYSETEKVYNEIKKDIEYIKEQIKKYGLTDVDESDKIKATKNKVIKRIW